MQYLGMILDCQARHDEAEALELEALEIRAAVFGAEHPDHIHAINNLGLTWHNQGRYEKAEEAQS